MSFKSLNSNIVNIMNINVMTLNNKIPKNPPSYQTKDTKKAKSPNLTFICDNCKKIPLIFFSQKNPKMIKFCETDKNIEVLNPNNLLNMANLKLTKKKEISKDINITNINNINISELMCLSHAKKFINYCEDCSKDMCYSCSKEHLGHNIIFYSSLIPNKRDIREGSKILAEMKRDLEKFKNNTKEIIKFCENLISIKEIFINDLKSNLDFDKYNLNSLINLKNILSIKIKLIEKPYNVSNPFTELNNKFLKKIKNEFESLIKNNENNINTSYQNSVNILNESFEFNNDDYTIVNKNSDNNDFIEDKKYKSNLLKENNNNNINNYLNLVIKNDFSFPLINNNFENINKLSKMKYDLNNKNNINPISNINNINKIISSLFSYEESIIMNNEDIIFLINNLCAKFNKRIKKFYLCYRASKEGDTAEIFHKKCDYIKNIIIIISSRNKKKFGGFSTESWETNAESSYKKDENAFIFSLDNYQIFNVIKPEKALNCSKKFGPIFGKGEIFINDNFFKNASCCNGKEIFDYYDINGKENKEPLCGEKEFYVEELEVYIIDFENK